MLYYSSIYSQTNKELSLVLYQQNEPRKVGSQFHCLTRTDSEYAIPTVRKKRKRQNSISQKNHYFWRILRGRKCLLLLIICTGRAFQGAKRILGPPIGQHVIFIPWHLLVILIYMFNFKLK